MKMRLAMVAAVALTAFGAGAEVKVSALFGPHMVLPRDCEIPVWGKADPGEKVKVEFAGKSAEATADKKGAWAVKLPPFEGSREGRDLTVTSQTSQTPQTFPDVLVGDVFLYAGGNEAEAMYRMPSLFSKTDWGRKMDVAAEVKSCEGLTDIRLYRDKAGSMIPVTEFPSKEKWQSIKDFKESAPIVARHFGEAWMARTGVPCGFINVSFYYRTFIEFIMPDAFEYCRGGAEYKNPKEFYDSYLRLLRGLADFGGRVGAVTGATDDTTFASDDIIDIKMRFGAAAYGAVIAATRFPIRAAVWVDPGNPGYFSKAEYEDVLKSMFSGWRTHSPRDFKVTVIPRKGARRAVCDKAVAELLDGSAPEPLKKVFELKDPASLAPSWGGGFAVSKIFGDHMVLQHGKKHPVWGKGRPGEKVTVSYGGKTATAVADKTGSWEAVLPPLEIRKEGTDLTVKGETGSAVFHDVLCGDVWYSAGQSNAEMSFNWGCIRGAEAVAESSQYPNIRYTKFDHLKSLVPVKFQTCNGPWKVCDKDHLGGCSAMGYYFARRINIETGIPVGILDNNWSGSPIEPFIPMCGMRSEPYAAKNVQARLDAIVRTAAIGAMANERLASGARLLDAFAVEQPFFPASGGNDWCSQWNIMNEPIVRLPFTGITWYQGCSNQNNGKDYRDLMRALVKGWREKYGFEMPFYQVMLASFTPPKEQTPEGGDGYAEVREAQREVNDMIPNFGTALALDVGNPNDIHPKNKMDVGERLALWALRDVYGKKGVVVSGPWYEKMTLEGAKARIHFRLFGSKGLVAADKDPDGAGVPPVPTPDGKLKGFSLQDADGKWHFADAAIDGETVVVSSPEVKEAKNVRYAYRMHTIGNANLYNAEGLPALPFKTDAW